MSAPTMVRLRDLGNWAGGNTPSKSNPVYWTAGTVPWISPKDMKVHEIISSEDHITELALADKRVSLVPEGSVLFVTRSGILSHTFPVAITKLPVTINQDLKALTPREGISPRYVAHAIRGASQRILKECAKSGTTVASIETSRLLDFKIPIVGIREQLEIVAEIEKQFSRLDEAVANLKRVKANLKRYKASILKDAVEGRLVPTEAELARREGRSFESGEQLLQRVLEERRSQWQGKYDSPTQPLRPVDVEIPQGWTWITVSQSMRERIVNGLSIKESPTPTEVKALRLSAMSEQGLNFDDFRCLPIDPRKVEDIVIRESDFFVSRGNGSLELVGRGSPARKPKQAVIFPDTMMRIRFTEVAEIGPWFHALWSTRLVRRQIEKRVKTTAGIYKMAQPELASITVPFPPLAEQLRIVAEVDRRLSLLRGVDAEVDANLKRAQGLRQSTLQKALSSS